MSKEFIFELDYALYNEETGEAVFKPKVKGELVRCKDCLYHTDAYPYDEEDELIPSNAVFCQHFEVIMDKDWFCADGKRKDGEHDAE